MACLDAAYIRAVRKADCAAIEEMITTNPWPSFWRMKESMASWVARIGWVTFMSRVLKEEVITTLQPWERRSLVNSREMSEPPPVIKAVFPLTLRAIG